MSSRSSLLRIVASGDPILVSWKPRLILEAEGLDFSDSEDRAIFRGRVLRALGFAKVEVLQELAVALGATRPPRNRSMAARVVADTWIKTNPG